MDCTPDNVYPQSCKDQQLSSYKTSLIDSGYCEYFHSPRRASDGKYNPCRRPTSCFSDECDEAPKENISLQRHQRSTMPVTPKKERTSMSVTPKKERTKESGRSSDKDFRREQQPLSVGWCETPKVYKKDASLRRRLLAGESATDVKTDNTRTSKVNDSSISIMSEPSFRTLFDSPDTVVFGALASSTLKVELSQPLSGGKRRMFFSQTRTSTSADGASFERPVLVTDAVHNKGIISDSDLTTELPEMPILSNFLSALAEENTRTPVNQREATHPSVLITPSSTPTIKYQRSESEDSGFGSLPTDKSQDSSLDHDGSFQELLPSYRSCESSQRRSRLQRQRRLSTLREGGSQSEEPGRKSTSPLCTKNNLPQGKHQRFLQHQSLSKENEVFVFDNATPCRATFSNLSDIVTPLRATSDKQDDFTPLWTSDSESKLNTTPRNTSFHAHQDDLTPLWTPASKLNKTPRNTSFHAPQDDLTPLWTPASKLTRHDNATPIKTVPHGDSDYLTPLSIATLKLENLSLTPALQLVHAICQQRARRLTVQIPSIEEELRSVTALAETPVSFRTTMPLAGLIGRKMGLGKVDVLTELKSRNLRHILSVILGHLSAKDVYRFGQVCKTWNEMILQDSQASCRRRLYLEADMELGAGAAVPDAETRLALLKRQVLASVQARATRTPTYCTPQSARVIFTPVQRCASDPGSSCKREKFIQVAKTLFNDEHLKQCPRCQHPARCHSVRKEGVCSRADCSFQFCTDCLCAFHGSKECYSRCGSRSQSKKDRLLPGSARSKRNVRRL